MSALSGLGLQLLAMLLLLGGVAVVLTRLGRRAPQKSDGPLELVARMSLDGRRAIYLVRAGKKLLVVGSSEAGLCSLSSFDARELEEPRAEETRAPAPSISELEEIATGVSAAELLGLSESPVPPRSMWRRGEALEEDTEGEGFTSPSLSNPRASSLPGEE